MRDYRAPCPKGRTCPTCGHPYVCMEGHGCICIGPPVDDPLHHAPRLECSGCPLEVSE